MRRDFKLAVLADPGTFTNQIVRQFGDVSEVGADGWPDDSEAVIFDCAHPEIGRHRETWCRVLDGSGEGEKPILIQALLAQLN